MKLKEGKLKEWDQKIKKRAHKMKEWTMNSYLLSENYIAYGILPQ